MEEIPRRFLLLKRCPKPAGTVHIGQSVNSGKNAVPAIYHTGFIGIYAPADGGNARLFKCSYITPLTDTENFVERYQKLWDNYSTEFD